MRIWIAVMSSTLFSAQGVFPYPDDELKVDNPKEEFPIHG
jgi:hypothetical protein